MRGSACPPRHGFQRTREVGKFQRCPIERGLRAHGIDDQRSTRRMSPGGQVPMITDRVCEKGQVLSVRQTSEPEATHGGHDQTFGCPLRHEKGWRESDEKFVVKSSRLQSNNINKLKLKARRTTHGDVFFGRGWGWDGSHGLDIMSCQLESHGISRLGGQVSLPRTWTTKNPGGLGRPIIRLEMHPPGLGSRRPPESRTCGGLQKSRTILLMIPWIQERSGRRW